jgi:AcrR family transcriptional regulator
MPVAVATLEERIVDGMLRCVSRWGVAKTTLEDVAREAGCSRATLYRAFPGGKAPLIEAVASHEIARFFATVTGHLDEARTLEDLLVTGITEAITFVDQHEALRYLLTYEPEVVLPSVAFHRLDRVLAIAVAFTAPFLARFLPDDRSAEAAEWVARVVLSYVPNPAGLLDPREPDSVRHLVRTFLLPGITQGAS